MKTKSRLTNFKKVQRRQFLKGSALATGGVFSGLGAQGLHHRDEIAGGVGQGAVEVEEDRGKARARVAHAGFSARSR